MRGLALAPRYNSKNKHDATGAFIPEAKRFAELHGLKLVLFDNRPARPTVRREVLEHIRQAGERLECVAFFCHGFKSGIQAGFDIQTVRELADKLYPHCTRNAVIPLYCCSTARDLDRDRRDDQRETVGGDGGFADVLRDELSRRGMVGGAIYAHTVVGHTTKAPYVRRFTTNGQPMGGYGGEWLIAPTSPLFPLWRQALSVTDLRWRYPFMGRSDIEHELDPSTSIEIEWCAPEDEEPADAD